MNESKIVFEFERVRIHEREPTKYLIHVRRPGVWLSVFMFSFAGVIGLGVCFGILGIMAAGGIGQFFERPNHVRTTLLTLILIITIALFLLLLCIAIKSLFPTNITVDHCENLVKIEYVPSVFRTFRHDELQHVRIITDYIRQHTRVRICLTSIDGKNHCVYELQRFQTSRSVLISEIRPVAEAIANCLRRSLLVDGETR